MTDARKEEIQRRNRKFGIIMTCIAIGMFGFGFALVPIYNVMCKQFGINGKTAGYAQAASGAVDKTRYLNVMFLGTNNKNLPWKFYPKTHVVHIHPGENTLISYYAKNTSDHGMTIQAIPSITPGVAAKYFKKTQCFCFTKQHLKSHQGMNMPVLFHVDTQLPRHIHEITLAYTLFDVTKWDKKGS